MFFCKALTKVYRESPAQAGFTALDGVDLELGRGEFVAVVGPSGCGKSTLLHLLGALDRPTSGSCVVAGRETGQLSDTELSRLRRQEIGFVFQFFHLLPRLSAYDNVALPMVYAGLPRRERRERAQRLLEMVGLAGKGHSTPLELSGGERQRVAIARALANDPQAILADEPTGNLDTRTGHGITELFQRLYAEGRTVVVATHDASIASRAGRIVHLRDGRIVEA